MAGSLTQDARDALEALRGGSIPEHGGVWEAAEWFINGPHNVDGLSGKTTDDELEEMAEQAELEARDDADAKLTGTLEWLKWAREEVRDRESEEENQK